METLNTTDKIKVLYLDDESHNLICFMATYRFDFTIYIAPTAAKAYNYLEAHPDISVVIADQRMPLQTGVEFFEEMKVLYPKPVRMLITAFADIEAVIDSVNRGSVFRYIKKPWNDDDVKSAVEEAYKFYISNSLLEEKNKELASAYRELGKFAYSVTHDLRSPLSSLLGALEVSKDMDSLTDIREILGMMDVAVRKLDDFIKNIHEFYSIKRGLASIEDIDFEMLAEDMAIMFSLSAKMDNIKFTRKVVQGEGFCSDSASLRIIIINLLSNAFKYQKKDGTDRFVELDIEVRDNNAHITVRDNGIGIKAEHINSIFSMFYRATTEQSGSGFGLFNVKDALERLNGTVEVSSAPDKGSEFRVSIPNITKKTPVTQ